jgi:hypothetical protein
MTFLSLSLRCYALNLAAELTFRLMKECGIQIHQCCGSSVFLHLDPVSGSGLFLIPDIGSNPYFREQFLGKKNTSFLVNRLKNFVKFMATTKFKATNSFPLLIVKKKSGSGKNIPDAQHYLNTAPLVEEFTFLFSSLLLPVSLLLFHEIFKFSKR